MERTLCLVALLREAEEVKAPKGVPCDGKVVSFLEAQQVSPGVLSV